MNVRNTIALVTGANRGLGLAFVETLLERGAPKVYAVARRIADIFPDAMSQTLYAEWLVDHKGLEQQFAANPLTVPDR